MNQNSNTTVSENSKKIFDFIKSLFLPRKMVKHINMPFLLALVILLLCSCLNIVTSNTRAGKDTERSLEFPTLFESIPDDIVLTEMTTNEAMTRITIEELEGTIEVVYNGVKQEVAKPAKYLNADKNGVYHGTYSDGEKTIDLTVVVDDTLFTTYGTVANPYYIDFFDIEGYFQQKRDLNTEYVLYVLTYDNFFHLFDLDQMEDGKSTKAISNSAIFETNEAGELKYYLPLDESELVLNQYGNFDTSKWTRLAASTDKIDFAPTEEYFNTLGLNISYSQYLQMVSEITPAYRHLKNITNALYGGAVSYNLLEAEGFDFEKFNTSINTFQKELKNAIIVYYAGILKTTGLFVSVFITLVFSLLLSFITWIMSRNAYMNKFRQYYAICTMCFVFTTIIALIAGFFINYNEIAFPLLVIASIYYIIATFRINTMDDDSNKDDKNNSTKNKKEPIKYSKISNDTSIIG